MSSKKKPRDHKTCIEEMVCRCNERKGPRELWVNMLISRADKTPWTGDTVPFLSYPICATIGFSKSSVLFREVTPSDFRKDAYIAMLEEQNKLMSFYIHNSIDQYFDRSIDLKESASSILAREYQTKCAQIRARFEEGDD
jgi:hypothetical protein